MPALELFDTVVIAANRQLVGVIDRIHHVHNDPPQDPLQDMLIIAHTQVDPTAITAFVKTGNPPQGYVFVRFSNEAQGRSLVLATDVVLVNRTFQLGDVVKKGEGHMLGTITSIATKHVLEPVWMIRTDVGSDDGPVIMTTANLMSTPPHTCSPDCPSDLSPEVQHPWHSCLLHGIQDEELKRADDVLEADYIIQDDWVGIVETLEHIVVLLLEDGSVVVTRDVDELFIPVLDGGHPLVSLPEYDDLPRPDPVVTVQGLAASIAPEELRCGQFVVTNSKNIRYGRWLRGHYNPKTKPQGHILDVRTRSLEVKWLACNAFTAGSPFSVNQPPRRTRLYDNISTFSNRADLISNTLVSLYDDSRLPSTTETRTRWEDKNALKRPSVRSPADFRVGDHVKFRDQAGAAMKYQGTTCHGHIHGRFNRISSANTYGFDVNELKIIHSRNEVTVRWHDGHTSTHQSTELTKFDLFEHEFAPSDLVVAREDMKQATTLDDLEPKPESLLNFDEMKFFERPYDLFPRRVGIVQSVDHAEQIAQVRWFERSTVRLSNYGHVLFSGSRFGKCSDRSENVSLYEIMTFPALTRQLKDLVVIPSKFISSKAYSDIRQLQNDSRPISVGGQTSLSNIDVFNPSGILYRLRHTAAAITSDMAEPTIIDDHVYHSHPTTDWVGEIVSLDLDGVVTVRSRSSASYVDVRLEHDQIICFVDEAAIAGTDSLYGVGADDTDMDWSADESEDVSSIISATIEYEGGERLDDDSGDENWEDANEKTLVVNDSSTPTPATRTVSPRTDVIGHQLDQPQGEDKGENAGGHATQLSETLGPSETTDSLLALRANLPPLEPPSFAVLDRPPPEDQYRRSIDAHPSSPTFLKRVTKEHRTLASSLPRGQIFVRTYENRLDLLRCLILGPADTPYEYAPFLIDLALGPNFPRDPPLAHFHSWTGGLGRINPNLYEEGKICLSLLGTWPGQAAHEGWSERATILQLLVSLQGLVFVRQPFYNEAGFEGYAETQLYDQEARRYNEKAYLMARGFVRHAVRSPIAGLEDVLAWTYLAHDDVPGLLHTVVSRSYSLIQRSEDHGTREELVDGTGSCVDQTKAFLNPLSRGARAMLTKTTQALERLMQAADDIALANGVGEVSENGLGR